MKKILPKIVALILTLAAIGLGLWLVNKNLPATNQLVVAAEFGRETPMLSSLGPPPRLTLDYPHQLILDSPVYFNLRSLSWFTRGRIELVYREEGRTLVSLAGKVGEPWQYATLPPLVITKDDEGWQHAIFDVDLTSLYHPKNIRRFLIDTSGPVGQPLRLQRLQITLER